MNIQTSTAETDKARPGPAQTAGNKPISLDITGMTCAAC